jgi:hypothetical protein
MDLARAHGKQFGAPPVLSTDVEIALLGPTTETSNHRALAGAGRTGHQNLAKADIAGNSIPFKCCNDSTGCIDRSGINQRSKG